MLVACIESDYQCTRGTHLRSGLRRLELREDWRESRELLERARGEREAEHRHGLRRVAHGLLLRGDWRGDLLVRGRTNEPERRQRLALLLLL